MYIRARPPPHTHTYALIRGSARISVSSHKRVRAVTHTREPRRGSVGRSAGAKSGIRVR